MLQQQYSFDPNFQAYNYNPNYNPYPVYDYNEIGRHQQLSVYSAAREERKMKDDLRISA